MDAVTKRFGGRAVLREVSFALYPGEVVGFVGLNGAGKTTSLRVLMGLLAPSSGQALVLGAPMRTHSATGRVGALVDRPAFHPHLGAATSLRMFGLLRGDRASALESDVPRVLNRFGVSEYRNKKFRELSTGMRQRVALAYAFLGGPPVVVLDEPNDGLDPEGVASLRGAIQERSARGGTVLFSSHLLSEVEAVADRVIIIHEGAVIADQPAASLLKAAGLRVSFETAETAALARTCLLEKGWSPGSITVVGSALRIDDTDGPAVARALSSFDLFPTEMHQERPSLEATFLGMALDRDQEPAQ